MSISSSHTPVVHCSLLLTLRSCGLVSFEAFFKNLFKSIHIVELLKDVHGKLKTSPEMLKVQSIIIIGGVSPEGKENTLYSIFVPLSPVFWVS